MYRNARRQKPYLAWLNNEVLASEQDRPTGMGTNKAVNDEEKVCP